MEWIIALLIVSAWFLCSRSLFRHWVRIDYFTTWNDHCNCPNGGYHLLHRGHPCHKRVTLCHSAVAGMAMISGIAFPVVILMAGVMYKAPVSPSELKTQIEELEKENNRLQQRENRGW
jgi:hypothetical protein